MERETIVEGVPADSVKLASRPQLRGVETSLQGSILVLIQFDVAEEIRLDELRKIFSARTAERQLQTPGPRIRPVPAAAGGGADRGAGARNRRAPRRPDQVLRLRRAQRGLRAALFRRLGRPRAPVRPLGLGHRLRQPGFADRQEAPGARPPGPDQALRATGCTRTISSSTCARSPASRRPTKS